MLLAAAPLRAQPTAQRPSPTEHNRQVADFQRELNAEFTDPARSPLPAEARRNFAGLPFYPPD